MARISTASTRMSTEAGAFELDSNLCTMAGYATLAGGVTLAGAVGTAVLPLPTLGLGTLGAGLVVAGNIDAIKAHFAGDEAVVNAVAPSAAAVADAKPAPGTVVTA